MADILGEQLETPTFCRYAEPFFLGDRCPHLRRVLEETGRFTQRHARIQRRRLENHVFHDSFAAKRLSEITRTDIFDLRSRLLQRCSPAITLLVVAGTRRRAKRAPRTQELFDKL